LPKEPTFPLDESVSVPPEQGAAYRPPPASHDDFLDRPFRAVILPIPRFPENFTQFALAHGVHRIHGNPQVNLDAEAQNVFEIEVPDAEDEDVDDDQSEIDSPDGTFLPGPTQRFLASVCLRTQMI
jgi:hypothetical protein